MTTNKAGECVTSKNIFVDIDTFYSIARQSCKKESWIFYEVIDGAMVPWAESRDRLARKCPFQDQGREDSVLTRVMNSRPLAKMASSAAAKRVRNFLAAKTECEDCLIFFTTNY